jgi:RNA polymerase sigma factor (sigma-70 family)
MRRIQADDVRAFEALYDRYSARAFGLARVICGGSRRAEEAVQDGFLSLWRSRASYDPARGNPGAWLLTVIRYRSIDVMRRGGQDDRLRESDGQLDYLPALGSVAKDAEAHDEATRLRASLHALPAARLLRWTHSYRDRCPPTAARRHRQRPDAPRSPKAPRRDRLQPPAAQPPKLRCRTVWLFGTREAGKYPSS